MAASRSQTEVVSKGSVLSRRQLVALALSSFIPAVGIASFPVLLIGTAGYGSWVAALISAIAGFAIGRSIIVFARRYVVSGSLSTYVGEVFGPWAKAAAGAALALGYVGQLMCVIVLFSMYASSFLIGIGYEWAGEPTTMVALILAVAIISAVVAWRGLDTSVKTAVALTVISVPLLLVVSFASAWSTGLELPKQLSLDGSSVPGIFIGLAAGAAWLASFESAASLATETSDPKKNVPAAVMAWPKVLGPLYILVTVLQVPGLMKTGEQLEAGMSAPAALAVNAGLGTWFGQITDLLLAISVFAAAIGFMNYASHVTKSFAASGMIPRSLGKNSPRFGTPYRAIILNTVLAAGILTATMIVKPSSIFAMYTIVATLTVYFWVLPYVLICAGAVALLIREKVLTASTVLWSAVGIATMSWLLINSFVDPPESPVDIMTYVAIITVAVLGAVFYLGGRRYSKRIDGNATPVQDGPQPDTDLLTADEQA
ncbi:amino acid transporter [Rhodococcus sp. SMB37]|uniref:APC family permease n=1 Tax=Rhodococcus sp. SMB37 TaxID=2512213 RepID=UPI0010E5C5B7|nr:APC family permease [Rhodococcus sp. SMB37]TCN53396.1 amino acid transporter [Rhodococcus sp. SMB37]